MPRCFRPNASYPLVRRRNQIRTRMINIRTTAAVAICCCALSGRAAQSVRAGKGSEASVPPQSQVRIDASRVLNHVTNLMYGSCIEDVNHEIYGGLYSQMIFGESFEEPAHQTCPAGWRSIGTFWSFGPEGCRIDAAESKLLFDKAAFQNLTAECDILPEGQRGIAGFMLRVQNPRRGFDAWTGYEVAIGPGNSVRIGRHRDNWEPIKDMVAPVRIGEWNRFRVTLTGGRLQAFLGEGAAPVVEVNDDTISAAGLVGLRVFDGGARFRNFRVQSGSEVYEEPFKTAIADQATDEPSAAWDRVVTGSAQPLYEWGTSAYNTTHSQMISMTGGTGTVGVANRGLNRWGLSVHDGARYTGYIHLRQEGYKGAVTVALQNADGSRTYAEQKIKALGTDWKRHKLSLVSSATDNKARLAILIDKPGGKVWADQVYLSPTGKELFRGLPMRADIGEMLVKQGLTFLRYGGSMVNAPEYRWKKMIGDPAKRPQYKGTWYDYSTNGFGVEEFVQFCQAAGFDCTFAINIEETPEDAADLVEYFNGPATSPWGKRRAENGHPKPYALKYIQIGNEESTNLHYLERFKILYEAMHAKDPALKFVIAAWWEPDNPVSRQIVEQLNGKADYWDVHIGGDDLKEGDNVDKLFARMKVLLDTWTPGNKLRPVVFEENGGRHDMQRALGHAHILNTTQRHGDFVLMDCPANCLQPLGQNDNGWDQGQLFFTNNQVWGMPPYYAQQMASRNHLPCRVESEVSGAEAAGLDVTVTRSEDGKTLVIKAVNIREKPHTARISLAGFSPVPKKARVWTMAGQLTDKNTPEQPERIMPKESRLEDCSAQFDYEFPAYSYTVMRLEK